jgi:SAM-dependent methyltransferase
MQQSHRSDPRILNRRTLQNDHRYLASVLRSGLSVLDVGCGSGAITAGIAEAVGPRGFVVGVDRDEANLELARREHPAVPNLRLELGDATSLTFHAQFDIVTAARTLQWISEPGLAILKMKEALKPSGMLVVLDYNLTANEWAPDPPNAFRDFYAAFLAWRKANLWDNEMADHLPGLFQSAGLIEVESHVQDEVAERGSPHFDEQANVWFWVIETLGEQLTKAGFLNESQLREAAECYQPWTQTELVKQTMRMRTVVGIKSPTAPPETASP